LTHIQASTSTRRQPETPDQTHGHVLEPDRACGVPKTRGGKVDALRVARRSAVAARADAQRQIKPLIVTAPDALWMTLRGLGDRELIAQCATRRAERAAAGDPTVATMLALRALVHRHQQLTVEIDELGALIGPLVTAINPTLIGLSGVGKPRQCWPRQPHHRRSQDTYPHLARRQHSLFADSGQRPRWRCSAMCVLSRTRNS
jgi:hypothetical protein